MKMPNLNNLNINLNMSPALKKRMKFMLLGVGILFGAIFAYKIIMGMIFSHMMATNGMPPVTVSATQVSYTDWQPEFKASGSVRAAQGVNVTTEIAGMVQKIYFESGAMVKAGTPLVQLKADADIAQLQALQANAELAATTYKRDQAQYAARAISKATLDTDAANLKNLQAQVAQQTALVAKKTIVAPFSGQVGICAVDLGQFLNPGDKIASLQNWDPVYVDFYVPQQTLAQLQTGLAVNVTTDAYTGETFTGKITAIDPAVDDKTRNAEIEATLPNPQHKLIPGTFVAVVVNAGAPQRYLTLPQTAITFNPYGSTVFILTEKGKDKKGNPQLIANEAFVTTGNTRGDQIAVLQGLKAGDTVATSGQIKLKNDTPVIVNNSVVPANNPTPTVTDY